MNPNKVWLIARHEYVINLRKARFIVFTLSVPVLAIIGVLVTFFFGRQAADLLISQFVPEETVVGLVDQTGQFTPVLEGYSGAIIAYEDEETGRAAVEDGGITVLYVLPEDYLETGGVTVVRAEEGNAFEADLFLLEEYISESLLIDRVDDATRRRVLDPIADRQVITLAEGDAAEADAGFSFAGDFIIPYAFALLLSVSIFSSSGFLLGGVAEEKGNRVVELLLSSVTAGELLTGKVLGLGALGLTRVGFWIASLGGLSALGVSQLGTTIFSDAVDAQLITLALVYYVLGFLIFAVLLGAGGAVGGSIQESQQIGGILSIFAGLPLYLLAVTITNPNATIARVFSWFPLTAPTAMIVRLPFGEVPIVDIVGSIALCTLSLPLIIWGSAKVFRIGLLNYGNKPSLKQIARMLRE